MAPSYKTILERADDHFRSVTVTQPENLQCGRGCSLCCHGLFEIGSGDVPLIADGLSRVTPTARKAIVARAEVIVGESQHPNLRECSPTEKKSFFERTSETPCPNLDSKGACLIYESRPLVCRTFGLPLRNGDQYIGDVCELNFTGASKEQQLAAAWDLEWEDVLGPEDEFTIPEAILFAARLHGWSR